MKNSRIDSVALNGKQPLKIKPNHGWMIILLRRRVKKLMNMNEQPETQLAEPKEQRTRFPLCQVSLQREKKKSKQEYKNAPFEAQ